MPSDASARLARLQSAVDAFATSGGGDGAGPAGMLRVTIVDDSREGRSGVDRLFDALGATMDEIPQVLTEVVPTVREAHRQTFATEGAAGRGPWAALAPRTLAERARLNYPPGPILERSGALKRHVLAAEAQINRRGSGFELRIAPDRSVQGVPKYFLLARGGTNPQGAPIPGRPMVAVGPAQATKIGSAVMRALRARARANGLR